ncbi:MAG TPA: NUDIX hydrolase, partial [Candidatus Marinimicrobia bacterium]|nr:NUDIX hydrolase [Candidatus Neomarinimicrobiota bacterium]
WVVSPDKDQILMNHHKNLGKWLQFGGHADGEEDLLSVAIREAKEESGIQNFTVLSTEIFDMDIHEIPERMDQPAHRHYDVRFLLEADPFVNKIVISDESYDVAWVSTERAVGLNPEMSIKRMVRKTLLMKNN